MHPHLGRFSNLLQIARLGVLDLGVQPVLLHLVRLHMCMYLCFDVCTQVRAVFQLLVLACLLHCVFHYIESKDSLEGSHFLPLIFVPYIFLYVQFTRTDERKERFWRHNKKFRANRFEFSLHSFINVKFRLSFLRN